MSEVEQLDPVRKIFYIDVGSMPSERVKAYIEAIKQELKQKPVPREEA